METTKVIWISTAFNFGKFLNHFRIFSYRLICLQFKRFVKSLLMDLILMTYSLNISVFLSTAEVIEFGKEKNYNEEQLVNIQSVYQ